MYKIISFKLHNLGRYGTRNISIFDLKEGLKGYSDNEIEENLMVLFKKNLIVFSNTGGKFGVSLNPKMKKDIEKMLG